MLRSALRLALAVVPLVATTSGAAQVPAGMARVEGGTFRPLYNESASAVRVPPFAIDTVPVSQAQFLSFIAKHPEWSRGGINATSADADYLARGVHAIRISLSGAAAHDRVECRVPLRRKFLTTFTWRNPCFEQS
jgi:formylglycine-generating enzyme required for sulfatase activity